MMLRMLILRLIHQCVIGSFSFMKDQFLSHFLCGIEGLSKL